MLKEISLTNEQAGMRYVIQGHLVIVEAKAGSSMEWKRVGDALSLSDLRAVVAAAGPDETSRSA